MKIKCNIQIIRILKFVVNKTVYLFQFWLRPVALVSLLFTSFIIHPLRSATVNDSLNGDIEGTTTSDSGRLYNSRARHFETIGDFVKAEWYYHKALDWFEKVSENRNFNLGVINMNLSGLYTTLWRFDEARICIENAIAKITPEVSLSAYGAILVSKGIMYSELGDHHLAILWFEEALKYFGILRKEDLGYSNIINLYNSLGELYRKKMDFHYAIFYYGLAEEEASKLKSDIFPGILTNIGIVWAELEKNNKMAEHYFQKSIAAYIQKHGANYFLLTNVYNSYLKLARPGENLTPFFHMAREAERIALASYGPRHPETAEVFYNMARLHQLAGQPDSMLLFIQKAIVALTEGYNNTSPLSQPPLQGVNSKIHLLKTLQLKAKLLDEAYQQKGSLELLDASLQTCLTAIALIDDIRLGYLNYNSRIYLAENQQEVYHLAMAVAFRLADITGNESYRHTAFMVSEKGKAAVLLASVRDEGARGFGGIPDSLLLKEKGLVRDMAFYREQLYEEKRKADADTRKIALWESRLFAISTDYEKLIASFEHNYPDYYALKYNTAVKTVPEVAKKLPAGSAMVTYTMADSVLYVFVLGKGLFDTHRIPLSKSFHVTLGLALDAVRSFDPMVMTLHEVDLFHTRMAGLYTTLIGPFAQKVKGKSLIIVPDDKLAYLPFDALVSQYPSANKGVRYLLQSHAISFAYSATLLFEKAHQKDGAKVKGMLAFAPTYAGGDTALMRGNHRSAYRKDLLPIPGAREEVEKILRIFKGDFFDGAEATEHNFKLNSANYRFIHLAMHAILNNEDPMFSKLVFSATPDSVEDGLLNTHELFNLRLNARMIVLSSCRSGEGRIQGSEGVMSLARGFSYAGCPSLIMTLWELEDKTSVRIMEAFYRQLKRGKPKDEALRLAKLSYLKNNPRSYQHPFYWAAYQCIGDSSPVSSSPKIYIWTLSLLLLLGVLVYIRRKRVG